MNGRPFKAVVIAAAVVGLFAATQQTAVAGKWLFKPSLSGGPHLFEYQHDDSDYSHLSDTAPAKPHPRNVPYSVTLHNTTGWTIYYSLNDQQEPKLKPGESVTWTVMGTKENPAHFGIKFGNGQKKELNYRLDNNTTFEFKDKGVGFDLYKKK